MILRARGGLLARAVAILFAAALMAQCLQVAMARDEIPGEAPDFALKATTGRNFRLSEYRSDVVVVAFWASWCGDCRDGLGVWQKLQDAHRAEGLQVLAVSFDEDARAAADAARAANTSFPVLLDAAGETGRLYDVRDLPLVVLIDREGRLRTSLQGRSATEQAVATEIRALLDE